GRPVFLMIQGKAACYLIVISLQSRHGTQRFQREVTRLLLESSAIAASVQSSSKKYAAAMCCYGMFLKNTE
ncbi:MAG TPA: hypothetical protein P5121_38995, partial [Caldilineaceae bacterium]|nr:hypothetical protein [Caldilineaceae bacterium]